MHGNDSVYVRQYLEGSEEALNFLVGKYIQPLYRFAFSYVKDRDAAEDIVQETFVKMWKKIETFDQNKEFSPWLYRIARNTVVDFIRKKKDMPLPEGLLGETNLYMDSLEYALRHISKHRDIVLLKSEGFTFEEIAEQTKKPLHTIKSQYRRAVLALREIFS